MIPTLKDFFKKQWFLISLVLLFAIGVGFESQLSELTTQRWLKNAIVATVLFAMALPLDVSAMASGLRRPKGTLLAILMNFGVLPLVALAVATLLSGELKDGFLVAAVIPCTLASASVWTRKAGGNDSISIMVTIITNLSCFVISPLWLMWFFGSDSANLKISFPDMVSKLGLLVVLPMGLAQVVRLNNRIGNWSTENKKKLSLFCQCGILSMVFIGAVGMGSRISADPDSFGPAVFAMAIVAVLVVHCSVFWLGIGTGNAIGLSRPDAIAVGFAGSQKTLMVGLQICMDLGVSILPMVAFHVSQLFADTIFADILNRKNTES